jgi:hypothetical protein
MALAEAKPGTAVTHNLRIIRYEPSAGMDDLRSPRHEILPDACRS